jgi:hypothetical protein
MLGSRLAPSGLLGLLLLLTAPTAPPAQAQTAVVCERALAAAEEQYLDAEYDEALRLVAACLNQSDIPQQQAVSAYRLLALIHLKQDALDSARAAVVNLLGIDPTYTADPVNSPPAYVSLVAIVQRDLAGRAEAQAADSTAAVAAEPGRTPFFRRTSTWVTLGGILVGSGVATALTIGGGGGGGSTGGGGGEPPGPGSLPIPPGTPPAP